VTHLRKDAGRTPASQLLHRTRSAPTCTRRRLLQAFIHRLAGQIGTGSIRQYQAYLFRERKLQAGTIALCTAALRFLYVKTLRRPYLPEAQSHFPKWSQAIARCAPSGRGSAGDRFSGGLMRRRHGDDADATGHRCSEPVPSPRSAIRQRAQMVIHIQQGQGRPDRDVLLSPKLLGTLVSTGAG